MAQKSLGKIYPKIEGDSKYGFDKISFIKSDTAFGAGDTEGQIRYDTSEKMFKFYNGSAEKLLASGTQETHIADAETSHALNATFSDTEVEAALNALGTTINSILAALEAFGITASS